MGQRLRITFARREGVKYLSHLEIMRLWERALRRAGWRLAYSQGFNPHPKMSFAAPLPVGIAGEEELLDVTLDEPRSISEAPGELMAQMPTGMEIRGVREISEGAPPVQRQLKAAEYLAICPRDEDRRLGHDVARLLGAEALPRQRSREGKTQNYDLRPMIHRLAAEDQVNGQAILRMELRIDAQGAGRPDEVLRELGLDPADCSITRTRLVLEER